MSLGVAPPPRKILFLAGSGNNMECHVLKPDWVCARQTH